MLVDLIWWVVLVVLAFVGLGVLLWLPRQRRVVSRDEAHVVVKRSRVYVYSGTSDAEGFRGTTYYYLPSWVPGLGMDVTVVPLSVLELKVPEMVTFAAKNARFTLSASVYVRVMDPLKAAQR